MKRFFRKIGKKFSDWLEEMAKSQRRKRYFADSMQRHHDYYVFLNRQGRLNPADREQYLLAMRREKAGEVDPLPENATSPFG